MTSFCDIGTFKEALRDCEGLLQEKELGERGVKEISAGIDLTRRFLNYVIDSIQGRLSSYEELLKVLQDPKIPQEYSNLYGLLGKFLDAIQTMKRSTTRNRKVRESIVEALERTGHDFLWKELEERKYYEEELLKATATCQLLEVAYLIDPNQSRNPISTLRNSMGARLPEEYFAELLAGWIMEDVLKRALESKGFDCALEGPDRARKIQFIRPTQMGVYDFKASREGNTFYLELQRVGKLSKQRDGKAIKTYLKNHKYVGGDSQNKILILWVGKPSQESYRKWDQRIVLISNLASKRTIRFRDENIYLPEKYFHVALTWDAFKQISGDEVFGLISKI